MVCFIRYHTVSKLTKDTEKMPVLLILILGTVMIIFWDTVKENVEVIGTLATSLAFLLLPGLHTRQDIVQKQQ